MRGASHPAVAFSYLSVLLFLCVYMSDFTGYQLHLSLSPQINSTVTQPFLSSCLSEFTKHALFIFLLLSWASLFVSLYCHFCYLTCSCTQCCQSTWGSNKFHWSGQIKQILLCYKNPTISICSLQFCTVTMIYQQQMDFWERAYLSFIDDV